MIGLSPEAGVIALTDHEYIYVCGNNIVIHNVSERTQRFIPGLEGSNGVSFISLTPCRRFLAVCERTNQAIVFIYDLVYPSRKRKVITNNELKASEFQSIGFVNPTDKL